MKKCTNIQYEQSEISLEVCLVDSPVMYYLASLWEAVLYALILLVTLGVLLAAVIVREPPRL